MGLNSLKEFSNFLSLIIISKSSDVTTTYIQVDMQLLPEKNAT